VNKRPILAICIFFITGIILAASIPMGDRSELPKKLNESFRNSGTMHILPAQNTKKLNYPS